jgi:hypothetical protein
MAGRLDLHHRIWPLTVALALVFLSRVIFLDQRQFNYDEVWHAWQTAERLDQVFLWLPYDWPPLYFVLLWAWQQLTGSDPLTLRASSVLIFMVACAAMYRLGRRWWGTHSAGMGALLAFAALGYYVFLSGYFRAYVLLLLLMPLALLAMFAYFDRPNLRRALLLALAMAAMFYTNLTAVVFFALMGGVSLLYYPRCVWRWWLPGLAAFALAVPEILAKLSVVTRRHAGMGEALPPFGEGWASIVAQFFGEYAPLWAVGALLGSIWLLHRRRLGARGWMTLGIWVVLLPLAVYLLDRVLGFFTAQYSWWIGGGLVLFWAAVFVALPRVGQAGLAAAWALSMFVSFNYEAYSKTLLPFERTLRVVAPYVQRGDVFLLDPKCYCGSPMEWTFYQQLYYPTGFRFVDDPAGFPRVWYVSADGWQDPSTLARVREGRIPSKFVGPWNLLIRLYEGPPDPIGVRWPNGMRFHGFQVMEGERFSYQPLVRREGEPVTVRLWWSADKPIEADLSVTLQLVSAGRILAQSDGAPQLIHLDPNASHRLPEQTSQWQPSVMYVEERTLYIPAAASHSDWTLALGVYQWWDGVRLLPETPHQDGLLPLAKLNIMAW